MNKYEFKKATKGKNIVKFYFDRQGSPILLYDDKSKYEIVNTYDEIEYIDVTVKVKSDNKQLVADLMLLTPKYVEQMTQKYSQNIEDILNLKL